MHTTSLELGISDFHKMSLTILKSHICRLKPQTISYRSYKHFNQESFLKDLDKKMISNFFTVYKKLETSDALYNLLVEITSKTLDAHAPLKSKVIRGNQANFMNKELRKAIMTRSRLKTRYNKTPTPENRLK